MLESTVRPDPDTYVLGDESGAVSTPTVHSTDHVFRLDPAPTPWWGFAGGAAVFACAFAGFQWFVLEYCNPDLDFWVRYSPVWIWLLVCVVGFALSYWPYPYHRRRGPWLIYEKDTGLLSLPRQQVRFSRAEVVHFQYVTSLPLYGRNSEGATTSELNLVTCRNGVRERWPILWSSSPNGAFRDVLHRLIVETRLPAVRVKHRRGGRVEETPIDFKSSKSIWL